MENWDLSFAHFSNRRWVVVLGYVPVPVPATLNPQEETPVPIDWEAATVRGSVWTIWRAGQYFAPAGIQSIPPSSSIPQHCRYADNVAT